MLNAGQSIPASFHYAWTFRSADSDLGESIDTFLRQQFRAEAYNVLARRYFVKHARPSPEVTETLSPYDAIVRQYADQYGFDWRLIIAQMYQESLFNPDAESSAGALGLMQLLPQTAASVGVDNPRDAEASIRGGVAYLQLMRQRFETDIAPSDRIWFALAAYNIGWHRVALARKQAAADGRDPLRWFGQVESTMARMASEGQCRCGQTVHYVRAIRSLYKAYHHQDQLFAADRLVVDSLSTQ